MSCPKGLRNGPCGGTLEGECEVYPKRECVWVRIHRRTGKDSLSLPDLIPSPDPSLAFTSSYLNWFTGRDKAGRESIPYLDLGCDRVKAPVGTASGFERALRSGRFVKTCEIRSPRGPDLSHFLQEARIVRDHFDAVNATAYLNAKPSLPSPVAAAELAKLGMEPICQATCRDHTKTSFISELIQNEMSGVHNMLCLTGDSYTGKPGIKQVFDMDSSLMLYEARYLREKGKVHFLGESLPQPPKIFLGAAINPFTQPSNVPIRRLKQKAAAGADFIQTQAVMDVAGFEDFMRRAVDEGLERDLFILAGVAVVITAKSLEMLPQIPGIKIPPETRKRLEQAGDLRKEGVALARETVERVRAIPGVAGVHLMLFGTDHSALIEVIDGMDDA